MIKKILVAFICLVATTGMYAQDLKFGHLNSQEFMMSLPETKEVMKKLDDLSKKYESEFSNLQKEFEKKYTEFVSQADTLPPAIKTRRTQEVTELQQKVTNFREEAMQDVQQTQQTLIAPIQEKVKKAIQEVATEQGFIYVFDTAVLLHVSDKSVDLAPLMRKKFGLE